MEHGKLQTILSKYKDLNAKKEKLEIKINSLNINIDTIEKQNEDYSNKIRKVKRLKKDLKLYSTMFLIFLIFMSIIIFCNYSLINLICVLGVTAVYLGAISSDLKTIIASNVKKINEVYYQNIDILNSLKEKEKQLSEELNACKINQNSSEKFLEDTILYVSKILSNETVNEIPVIPEVSISQNKDISQKTKTMK